MAQLALAKRQAVCSSSVLSKARLPMRSVSIAKRQLKPVQATVAFVETEVATDQSVRVAAKQRVQEVQAALGLKIMEAAAEAPARRIQRDRLLLAACIKAAALQHILAANVA